MSDVTSSTTLQDAVSAAIGAMTAAQAAQGAAVTASGNSARSATAAAAQATAANDTLTEVLEAYAQIQSAQAEVNAVGATANEVQALLEANLPTINNLNLAAVAAVVASGPVLSINGMTGIVTLSFVSADSPTFTGVPAAPTAAAGTSTTQLATTAFALGCLVNAALSGVPSAPTAANYTNTNQIATCLFVLNQIAATLTAAAYATLDSPVLTGVPKAPTAAQNATGPQLATLDYVLGQASSATPQNLGVAAAGTSLEYSRGDHVHQSPGVWTQIASTTVSGTPTVIEFHSLSQAYGDLLIIANGLEPSSGGVSAQVYLDVSVTGAGSPYSSTGLILGAMGSSTSTPLSFAARFSNYSGNLGMVTAVATVAALPSSPGVGQNAGGSLAADLGGITVHTGGCKALELRIAAGTFTAAGTVTIYAR